MIFIRGARQLLTLRGPWPRRGVQLSDLGMIPDGAVLIDGEQIYEVGSTRRIENLAAARSARVIDVTGKVVLPGFVDSHTRSVFSTPALREFGTRVSGSPEKEVDLFSEGPHRAARSLRTISPKVLRFRADRWFSRFAAHGTTTLDASSGYGLTLQSELKGLRLACSLDGSPLDVIATFLAACGDPLDGLENPEAAVEQVTEVLLPIIRRRRLASFCDVDCDALAFSPKHGRQILRVARQLGFQLKVQADRTARSGGARLAVEMRASSANHLLFADNDDIDLLADSSTVATLLPGVVYHRGGKQLPPARRMLDRGAAVALATGFGPADCPTLSMPMVLSLACAQMKMRPEEALGAATINGAAALNCAHLLGSLEPGKQADLAVFDASDYREIPYYFGINLCVMTMKRGKIIYKASGSPPSPAVPIRGSVGSDRLPHAAARRDLGASRKG